MTRQRLLLVTDSFSGGKDARHIRAILGRLSRRRFDVRVVSLFDGPPLPDEIERARVETHHLQASDSDPAGIADALAPLLQDGADVVHAHSLVGAAAVLRVAPETPLVVTVHDSPVAEEASAEGDLREVMAALGEGGARRRVLTATYAIRHALEEEWGVEHARFLPPFVEVVGFRERFEAVDRASARRQWALQRGEVAVLHVGEIHHQRRSLELLEAFQVAHRELSSLRLFVVGRGPALPEARSRAEELNLGDAAVFLGEARELPTLYRMADLFVLHAGGEEFPLALLDAMAVGLPAVIGGVEPVLGAVEAGAAVEALPDRIEDFARQILKLAFDPRSRAEMGRAAKERAAEYDVGHWIPRLEALYAEL